MNADDDSANDTAFDYIDNALEAAEKELAIIRNFHRERGLTSTDDSDAYDAERTAQGARCILRVSESLAALGRSLLPLGFPG